VYVFARLKKNSSNAFTAPQRSGDASEGDLGKERLDARNGNKLEVIWKYPRPTRNLLDDPNFSNPDAGTD
jgi:hypothetical protein